VLDNSVEMATNSGMESESRGGGDRGNSQSGSTSASTEGASAGRLWPMLAMGFVWIAWIGFLVLMLVSKNQSMGG